MPHGSIADKPRPVHQPRGSPNVADRKKIDPNARVTDLELRLVKEIAAGNSVWSAAIRAGYENSPHLGKWIYAVVAKPNVQRELAAAREAYSQAVAFTHEKAHAMLQEAYDMGRLMAEPMAMVGATREMIKMAGLNAPTRIEHTVNGEVQVKNLAKLSDQELLNLMNKPKMLPEPEVTDVVPKTPG